MELDEIEAILGRAASDAAVRQAMARHGIFEQPQMSVDENDVDGPVVATDDWLLGSAAGIEFGFEDEAAFLGFDNTDRGGGPMRLTQIYLYGKHPEVRSYAGRLPFGLRMTDRREIVCAKLAASDARRRAYIRDAWDLASCTLVVGYADEGSCIDFLLFLLSQPPLPRRDFNLAPPPALASIIDLLGRSSRDGDFRATFVPLGWDRLAVDPYERLRADFRATYGLELGFLEGSTLQTGSAGTTKDLVLGEAVFFRDRMLDATAWRGELPMGLTFDDSPAAVMHKLAAAPDEVSDAEFSGYMVWHLPTYSLQVHYTTMENLVLRVRVMAPGVWAAYSGR